VNHRVGRILFAIAVGLIVAVSSYRWITNPEGREARAQQVNVVEAARVHLRSIVASESLEIVDTLAPNRVVGKGYVFPEGDGWVASGYYRRGDTDTWHPFLMSLGPDLARVSLKLKDDDPGLASRAAADPSLEIVK
jgi:hypothetical protein